jgi:hypothetical protein
MLRALYNVIYVFFALAVPLAVFNNSFPFVNYFEMPLEWRRSVWGLFALIITFVFFGKNIIEWVKSFDRVTWLKGIFMWIVFVAPAGLAFVLLRITSDYATEFAYILSWTFLSHMVAGFFKVLAAHEKAKAFKQWVLK